MVTLAPLSAADPNAVESLLDAAFGSDRHTRTAYRLRAGTSPVPHLSLAAFDGERLVGTLQCWPLELAPEHGGAAEPLLLVGPVAVLPDAQGTGIGRAMMDSMLTRADANGDGALMLIGDPEYYGRFFGFDSNGTEGWRLPGPVERHRLLVRLRGGRTLARDGTLRARQPELTR